jgi:hypothetical protein
MTNTTKSTETSTEARQEVKRTSTRNRRNRSKTTKIPAAIASNKALDELIPFSQEEQAIIDTLVETESIAIAEHTAEDVEEAKDVCICCALCPWYKRFWYRILRLFNH